MGSGKGKTKRVRTAASRAQPLKPNNNSTDTQNAISLKAKQQLETEIKELETVERPKIVERIKTAREWGDLKENSEYHDAKNSQSMLETKILRLQEKLHNSVVHEIDENAASDEVVFGSTVSLVDITSKEKMEFTLVSSHEQNVAEKKLSSESPVGKAVIGQKIGDVAEVRLPNGKKRQLRVAKVSTKK